MVAPFQSIAVGIVLSTHVDAMLVHEIARMCHVGLRTVGIFLHNRAAQAVPLAERIIGANAQAILALPRETYAVGMGQLIGIRATQGVAIGNRSRDNLLVIVVGRRLDVVAETVGQT